MLKIINQALKITSEYNPMNEIINKFFTQLKKKYDTAYIRKNSLNFATQLKKLYGDDAQLSFLQLLFKESIFALPPISGEAYTSWRKLENSKKYHIPEFGPLISILLPVYNPNTEYLCDAINSVLNQNWPYWELCISDDASTDPCIKSIIKNYAKKDKRIRYIIREKNGHICASQNTALQLATGEWCALLDHDDILSSNSLIILVHFINKNKKAHVFFSDEDQFYLNDKDEYIYTNPFFKTNLDPDLLFCCNCVSHLGVYKTSSLRSINGFTIGYEGSQDYYLAFQMLYKYGIKSFIHIPFILYHWRRHENSTSVNCEVKPYVKKASYLTRKYFASKFGIKAKFPIQKHSSHTYPQFIISNKYKLSIIIIVDSLPKLHIIQHWPKIISICGSFYYEVIIICPYQYEDKIHFLKSILNIKIILKNDNNIFTLANEGIKHSTGSIISFFCINDMPITEKWGEKACSALLRTDVGIVGSRYRNAQGFFDHVGYAIDYQENNILACPAYNGLHYTSSGYFNLINFIHSVPATQLEGMFCHRKIFEEFNGFDQKILHLSDFNFCFDVYNTYLLRSVIFPIDIVSIKRSFPIQISSNLYNKWKDLIFNHPFQNKNLSWTYGGWKLRINNNKI